MGSHEPQKIPLWHVHPLWLACQRSQIGHVFMRAKQDDDFLEVYRTVLKLCEKRVNKQMITDEEIAAVTNQMRAFS